VTLATLIDECSHQTGAPLPGRGYQLARAALSRRRENTFPDEAHAKLVSGRITLDGEESGHGSASVRDDHLVSFSNRVQKLAEAGLESGDGYGLHEKLLKP